MMGDYGNEVDVQVRELIRRCGIGSACPVTVSFTDRDGTRTTIGMNNAYAMVRVSRDVVYIEVASGLSGYTIVAGPPITVAPYPDDGSDLGNDSWRSFVGQVETLDDGRHFGLRLQAKPWQRILHSSVVGRDTMDAAGWAR